MAASIDLPSADATFSAVVFDVDLGAGLLDDLADDLAARADHVADLVGGNGQLFDARCEFAQFCDEKLRCVLRDSVANDMGICLVWPDRRRSLDLFGDAIDLDVHLQRGDANTDRRP